MNTLTISKNNNTKKINSLKLKTDILDKFLEIIEGECLARLMENTEKEKNISFSKAKKLMK